MGKIKESLTHFSNTKHALSCSGVDGRPKMVKHMSNNWQLTADGKTKLTMHMEGFAPIDFLISSNWLPFF